MPLSARGRSGRRPRGGMALVLHQRAHSTSTSWRTTWTARTPARRRSRSAPRKAQPLSRPPDRLARRCARTRASASPEHGAVRTLRQRLRPVVHHDDERRQKAHFRLVRVCDQRPGTALHSVWHCDRRPRRPGIRLDLLLRPLRARCRSRTSARSSPLVVSDPRLGDELAQLRRVERLGKVPVEPRSGGLLAVVASPPPRDGDE
jgi:hypothetical protein